MTWRRLVPCLLLLALPAGADGPNRDGRGWLPGPVASNAGLVIAGIPEAERPLLDLPASLSDKITGRTLIFYFSPTCPHCRAVAAEVQGLATRLAARDTKFLWVASGSASRSDLEAFVATYRVTGEVVRDEDRAIVSAIAARSTPSALLVEPAGKKGKMAVVDLWYPYLAGFDGLIEGRVAGAPFASFAPGRYQGTNHCAACHSVEHLSWGLTHHSLAWRTLVLRDEHDNRECTSCHVIGAGLPGGWNGDPDSHLVDVGCEACHGPGGPHDGERVDARTTCASCHDAKHSIAFSVEKGLPLIDHFAADQLSDADFQERRRKLYNGETPRELLAFEDGAQVGAAACQTCHEPEHASWAMSSHATAMNALVKDDKRSDPACVRCHATARRSGPPPAELSGYHLLDGVGCESCHGPGERHVAAPTAENIEGLGEDCPVCVIEAVCTSCHNREQDPDWDLERALPKVGHGKR